MPPLNALTVNHVAELATPGRKPNPQSEQSPESPVMIAEVVPCHAMTLLDQPSINATLDQLRDELGRQTTASDEILLTQLAVAHQRVLELHGESVNAETPQAAALYTAAAAKLAAEVRKTVAAVQDLAAEKLTHRTRK